MKRFITYLYECERGDKSKNVGFIRVSVRGIEITMEAFINNSSYSNDIGKIFVLVYKEGLLGVPLGEVKILNGKSEERFSFHNENIMGSGCLLSDVLGIGIRLKSGCYISSCWREEYGEAVARGEFRIREDILKPEEMEKEELTEEVLRNENVWIEPEDLEMNLEVAEEKQRQGYVTYKKIGFEQIHDLPSPNWHLATNSFLVHGVANFGYLVLEKEMEEDKERLALGIPGFFEKPEAVMAILFGFPTFEEIPSEIVAAEMNCPMNFIQKEKNQDPKVGTFGCWFVTLQE